MTTSANPTLTNLEGIFSSLVWQPAITAGLTAFYASPVGVFLLPGKIIIDWFVKRISDWIYQQLILFIDIADIRLTNALHQKAYDEASVQLLVIAQERGIGSAEFLAAQKIQQAKLAIFVSLT